MEDTKMVDTVEQGVTVVITHRIKDNQHRAYEGWMEEISSLCKLTRGHVDW